MTLSLGRNGQKIKYIYDVASRLETVETYDPTDLNTVVPRKNLIGTDLCKKVKPIWFEDLGVDPK